MASLDTPAKKLLHQPEKVLDLVSSPVKVDKPLSSLEPLGQPDNVDLEPLKLDNSLGVLGPAPNRDKQRVLVHRRTDLEPNQGA